jgi:hypothetical protein
MYTEPSLKIISYIGGSYACVLLYGVHDILNTLNARRSFLILGGPEKLKVILPHGFTFLRIENPMLECPGECDLSAPLLVELVPMMQRGIAG